MERQANWISGNGMLFHCGSAQTGYPAVDVEPGTNRDQWRVVVRLPGGQGTVAGSWLNAASALELANQTIALILEAHAHGSAKKPDGGLFPEA